MNIMKLSKSLQESGLLIKGVSKIIKNEVKEQKWGFLRMLIGTLGAILLANLLTGKATIRAGKCTARVGRDFSCHHIFKNFWNTKVLSKPT